MVNYSTKRLFIASKIEVDPKLAEAFAFFKKSLSGEKIRWVDMANLHITYIFLGDTDVKHIPVLISTVSDVAENAQAIEIIIKSTGVFKNLQNPTVIWFGIEPNPLLSNVKFALDKKLEVMNYKLVSHLFRPHRTIGRMKFISNTSRLKELIHSFQEKEITKQPVSEIILFESKLTPTGPEYIPLHAAKFKHADL